MANPRMKHAKLFNTQVQMVSGILYNMSVHTQIIMSKTSKIDDLNVFIRVPLFFNFSIILLYIKNNIVTFDISHF